MAQNAVAYLREMAPMAKLKYAPFIMYYTHGQFLRKLKH